MAEYVRLTSITGYVAGPTNIGVIEDDRGQAVLIDTGIDASTAKKAVKVLMGRGLKPVAVISTHSHADHIGGNACLAGMGVPVYAAALEAPFIENPLLESVCLMGGASPWPGLRHKFLLAPPSPVSGLLQPGTKFPGREMEIINLSGHSLGQIGVLGGGVLFAGDSFLGEEVLQKHVIPYNVDIPAYLASLDRVRVCGAGFVVPGHGPALADPAAALQFNRGTVLQQVEMVRELLGEGPLSVSALLQKLFVRLNMSVASDTFYLLYRTATLAYLSYLCHLGQVVVAMANNEPVFGR
ncbi:MAG TPA: MBL fold metallo-hydrolase [Spirochaetia bacterium]|nr:MBL fold metallo-hydrolase [Spirochaetia bacterium]